MTMENKITFECKLTVSDETAKVCRKLLDMYNGNDDRPPRIDGGTVTDFVKYLNEKLLKYAHATMSTRELQSVNRRIAANFIEEYGE